MDKETLSNYGWIVIAVLVLVVMIALATPFGSFISEAVQSTTQGLFDVNKNALDAAGVPGLTVQDQEFDVPDMNHGAENGGNAGGTPEIVVDHNGATIPEGATYTKADGTILNAGEAFPVVENGDSYTFGDYEYRYNQFRTGLSWQDDDTNGWSVSINLYVENSKSTYGTILESINGRPITNMCGTFYGCSNLTTAPAIPYGVVNMDSTFSDCPSLITAPDLSRCTQLTSMSCTFQFCTSLTVKPNIPSSVTTPESEIFMDCSQFGY